MPKFAFRKQQIKPSGYSPLLRLRFGKYSGIYLFGWSITAIPIFDQWLADRAKHNPDFPKVINAHYTQKRFLGLVFTRLK